MSCQLNQNYDFDVPTYFIIKY